MSHVPPALCRLKCQKPPRASCRIAFFQTQISKKTNSMFVCWGTISKKTRNMSVSSGNNFWENKQHICFQKQISKKGTCLFPWYVIVIVVNFPFPWQGRSGRGDLFHSLIRENYPVPETYSQWPGTGAKRPLLTDNLVGIRLQQIVLLGGATEQNSNSCRSRATHAHGMH